jgi:hypothetical protein
MNATETRFVLPPAVYEQAVSKGKRNRKAMADYIADAAKVLGVPVGTLTEAIETETSTRAKREKQAGAKARLDDAINAAKGITFNAAQRKALTELFDVAATLELHCEVMVQPDGTLAINVQNSELSAKSVISPWLAYERGQKMGDTFRIEKVGTRHYKSEAGEEFTNLTGWIRQNQPNSHAAAVLRRYGQL